MLYASYAHSKVQIEQIANFHGVFILFPKRKLYITAAP